MNLQTRLAKLHIAKATCSKEARGT